MPALKGHSVRKWLLIGAAALIALCVAVYFAAVVFFLPEMRTQTRQRIQDYLAVRFQGAVQIGDFHIAFRPRLHIEVDGIVVRHMGRTDIPPLLQIQQLAFNANFSSLFGRRVDISLIRLDGLEINTPPREPGGPAMIHGTDQDLAKKYPVVIHRIVADQAHLVILRRPEDGDKPPNEFDIHQLSMEDFGFDRPASFQAILTNPKPRGDIRCVGQFGPWEAADPSQTPVAADYRFDHADMSTLKGLSGTMSSTGHFSGPLDYLNVDGQTDIPDFALRTSAHPFALHTDFSAIVDGTNGNTILKTVTARFLHTTLSVAGEVVDLNKGVKGRTIEMHATSNRARIDDLLLLAVKKFPPAMTGVARLDARIDIPENDEDLIDKMELDGRFAVAGMQFTNPDTQGKVDSLSRRGQGKPKDTEIEGELSQLGGHFRMENSVISLSSLNFGVEGAAISLAGTYNLDGGELDFRGHLKLDAKLSQTTTGVKSLFLRAVDPFFSKDGAGTELPIKVTGTKDAPSFGLDFHDKANKN